MDERFLWRAALVLRDAGGVEVACAGTNDYLRQTILVADLAVGSHLFKVTVIVVSVMIGLKSLC